MILPEKRYLKEDICCYDNFISSEDCKKLVEYYKSKPESAWTRVAFYESYGMNMEDDPRLENFGLPQNYISELAERMKLAVEQGLNKKVRKVSTHSQKWETGSYANFHSDNTHMDGTPSAFEKSKYVCLLYLNDDYVGGQLDFRDHPITIDPPEGLLVTFPGGFKNIHQVKRVKAGTRYTLGAFWDDANAEYTEERMKEWEIEIAEVREQQKEMYEQWDKNGKKQTINV